MNVIQIQFCWSWSFPAKISPLNLAKDFAVDINIMTVGFPSHVTAIIIPQHKRRKASTQIVLLWITRLSVRIQNSSSPTELKLFLLESQISIPIYLAPQTWEFSNSVFRPDLHVFPSDFSPVSPPSTPGGKAWPSRPAVPFSPDLFVESLSFDCKHCLLQHLGSSLLWKYWLIVMIMERQLIFLGWNGFDENIIKSSGGRKVSGSSLSCQCNFCQMMLNPLNIIPPSSAPCWHHRHNDQAFWPCTHLHSVLIIPDIARKLIIITSNILKWSCEAGIFSAPAAPPAGRHRSPTERSPAMPHSLQFLLAHHT